MKGVHLEGLRVLGKPETFAAHYYEQGADELLYMDVVASLYQRNSLLDLIDRTARRIFIPLTVGGGIRTLNDIRDVLRAGADKVSLNTAAINRPLFIKEAAQQFGSSTIVVSIEAIKKSEGRYEAYTDNGRESTGVDAFDWALRAAELGAGELLLTSIDREGTGRGLDLEYTHKISESVPIPVVACGGVGRVDDVYEAAKDGKLQGICLSSILHYEFARRQDLEEATYAEGNIDFLTSKREFSKIKGASLPEIKEYLTGNGVICRPVDSNENWN